jgi:hypothetical protein
MKSYRMHGPNMELEFAAAVRALPRARRREMLAWFRAQRRRRERGRQEGLERVFWLVTPTGERKRL